MVKLVVYNTHSSRVIVVMVFLMNLKTSMVLTMVPLLCVLHLVMNSLTVLGVLICRLPLVG